MLLKSVLFISIILISWESSSTMPFPDDFEADFFDVGTPYVPFPKPGELKPYLSDLKDELKEIYQVIRTKDSEISNLYKMKENCDQQDAFIKDLRSHKTNLQVNNAMLKTTIEKLTNIIALSSKNQTDVVTAVTSKNIESDVVTTVASPHDNEFDINLQRLFEIEGMGIDIDDDLSGEYEYHVY